MNNIKKLTKEIEEKLIHAINVLNGVNTQ